MGGEMECISYSIMILSRGKDRCAVQMAAYCAREKYHCERTGESFDRRDRRDLQYHEILLPPNAPPDYHDAQILWNSVENIEHYKNAQLARSVRISLPREFFIQEQIRLARDYAKEYFVDRGMCADLSIHDKGDGNPYVHILLTMRSIDSEGQWMKKQKANFLLDEHGNRIWDPEKMRYRLGRSTKINDWDEKERVEEWRSGWAKMWNDRCRELGIVHLVTHRSYERQGLAKIPTRHLGAKAKAMEDRGILTERGNINREINRLNQERVEERSRRRTRSRWR